jgi:RNA polymerase sigma factor (TIGR02999 family)
MNPGVTQLLDGVNAGQAGAMESLVSIVYSELRRMAGSLMRKERHDHTLQPTALVHEVYMRLVGASTRWENRAHFFGAAARAMRQILVGQARQRAAQKRGGEAHRVTFSDLDVQTPEPDLDLLVLNEALNELTRIDERLSRVVELRYFGGCSLEEIAELTQCSLATVKRDWTFARAWLYDYMNA